MTLLLPCSTMCSVLFCMYSKNIKKKRKTQSTCHVSLVKFDSSLVLSIVVIFVNMGCGASKEKNNKIQPGKEDDITPNVYFNNNESEDIISAISTEPKSAEKRHGNILFDITLKI